MNNKCIFCGENKPTNRPKFCSPKCVKRAWYCRRHPNCFFNNSKKFWESETGMGYEWELWASKKLGATHLPFNKSGCDLDLNGLKLDVKVCNLYKSKRSPSGQWVFNRGKTKPCDFFFCICLENDKVNKVLSIPNKNFPKRGATIGRVSKYDVFIIPPNFGSA